MRLRRPDLMDDTGVKQQVDALVLRIVQEGLPLLWILTYIRKQSISQVYERTKSMIKTARHLSVSKGTVWAAIRPGGANGGQPN